MRRVWFPLAGAILIAGCESQSEMLGNEQATAVDTALRRAQFEMACPTAAGTVLSRSLLQPALYGGSQHVEYTIGVQGCGKRETYVSVCPAAYVGTTACFAESGRANTSIGLLP